MASKKISQMDPKLSMADSDEFTILDNAGVPLADQNKRVTKSVALSEYAKTADLGTAAALDVGTGAGDVAAGDAPASAASSAVGTHESTFAHANLPTTAQKAAMDGAASPSGANVFATVGDVPAPWDGDIADIDLDGGTDIGADLADADLILVDDGGAGTNRKSALSRVWTYISAKIAALTDISTWASVLDEDTMASDSATQVPTQQSVKAYVDASTGDPVAISDTTPAEARPFWFKSDTGQLLVSYDGTYVEPAAGVSIGMPTAGTTGQVLVKSSGDDFDTEWADAGGGIAAPPSDGNYYAYKDGGWVNITNKIINP